MRVSVQRGVEGIMGVLLRAPPRQGRAALTSSLVVQKVTTCTRTRRHPYLARHILRLVLPAKTVCFQKGKVPV